MSAQEQICLYFIRCIENANTMSVQERVRLYFIRCIENTKQLARIQGYKYHVLQNDVFIYINENSTHAIFEKYVFICSRSSFKFHFPCRGR